MLRRFADLTVASDLPLSDLPAAEGPASIEVRGGSIPDGPWTHLQTWTGDAGEQWLSIDRAGGAYRLTFPELICVIEADGARVLYDERANLSQPALHHLLLHQVLPLAVSRLGRFVLHACAVETPAGALVFLGESGAGKSTLAATFCGRGCALVADDALVVDVSEAGVGAWPTADSVRLWPDMRDAAAGAAIEAGGKLRVQVPIARSRVPLARLCLLDTAADGASAVAAVSPSEVRVALLSHLFRLDVTDRAESSRLFDAAHRVAEAVPARRIIYPNGIQHLNAAADAALRDLAADVQPRSR